MRRSLAATLAVWLGWLPASIAHARGGGEKEELARLNSGAQQRKLLGLAGAGSSTHWVKPASDEMEALSKLGRVEHLRLRGQDTVKKY